MTQRTKKRSGNDSRLREQLIRVLKKGPALHKKPDQAKRPQNSSGFLGRFKDRQLTQQHKKHLGRARKGRFATSQTESEGRVSGNSRNKKESFSKGQTEPSGPTVGGENTWARTKGVGEKGSWEEGGGGWTRFLLEHQGDLRKALQTNHVKGGHCLNREGGGGKKKKKTKKTKHDKEKKRKNKNLLEEKARQEHHERLGR